MKFYQKLIGIGILLSLVNVILLIVEGNIFLKGFLALIIPLAVTIIFSYKYKKRLDKINEVIYKLSNGKGDLTIKLPITQKDELGEISKNFNKFIEEMEQIVAKVNMTSKLVAESSISLSENLISILDNDKDENNIRSIKEKMEFIGDSVNKQTAYSEEVAASTTEISQTINTIYGRTENAKELADATNKLAKESENNLVKNLNELKEIEESVEDIENRVLSLEDSSKKIYGIVEMINKITEQTNLLALNAAIEAARAGEAGKGFAVVADEVRKLATNSTAATSQIESLVSSIQTEVKDLVNITKESYTKVQRGRKTSEGTNKKILDIIDKINITSKEVEDISISIREQKLGVEEIDVAIDQVSNNSVEISNLSNDQIDANNVIADKLTEATGHSAKLSEIAEALKNIAISYKISENVQIKRNKAVEWSDDFSVKVSLMDDEHKQLFDLINDLNEAMLDGQSGSKISDILDSLIDYTKYHFGHEEEMLKKINYPHIKEQEMSHRAFVNKMIEFKNELNSGKMLLSVKMIDFLKDWLVSHIINTDSKYTGFAHKHGIK